MHELSTMMRLVNAACSAAEKEHAKRITKLNIDVGQMTDVVPEYLKKYFPEASKGTLAEGALLNVKLVHVLVRCQNCGKDYEPDPEMDRKCPVCGNSVAHIIRGKDTEVASIEIEEE